MNLMLDTFVMPTLFFVSGYFTPSSLENKGGSTFLKGKLKRLMLPWLFGVLILIPLYKVIFLASRGLPQETWTTYFHFSNGIFSQSWLWFLPVLFSFNVAYFLISKVDVGVSSISFKHAVLLSFLVGVANSFCMDIFKGMGWTKTAFIDFQNERLLIYFLLFLLGALAFARKIFEEEPESKKLYTVASWTAWIPITGYISLLIYSLVKPDDFLLSAVTDKLLLRFSFNLSLLCLVYLAVESFRRHQDKQSPIRNELNENSYYVYVIHVIVMGGIALAMLGTTTPSFLKYLVLTVSTYVISNLVVSLYRRATAGLTHASSFSTAK